MDSGGFDNALWMSRERVTTRMLLEDTVVSERSWVLLCNYYGFDIWNDYLMGRIVYVTKNCA